MKTTFFSTFFFNIFFTILYDKWCNDFSQKMSRDHKKKSEKIGFFRIFSDFFGFFRIFLGPIGQLLDNFGQLLDNFIGTFQ